MSALMTQIQRGGIDVAAGESPGRGRGNTPSGRIAPYGVADSPAGILGNRGR